MSGETLNLARRPFVNTRPVTRAALALWVLGGLLLLGNVSLFWTYLSGSGERRAELAVSEQEVEKEKEKVARLETQVAQLELEEQNEQAEYLNRRIAERTFSWSLLFDRLTEAMPEQMRLTRLTPSPVGGNDQLGRRRAVRDDDEEEGSGSDRVVLNIVAEAKRDDAHLEFQDRLFAHPSFRSPYISQEVIDPETGLLRFNMRVIYLPGTAARGAAGEPSEVPRVIEEPTPAPAATPPAPGAAPGANRPEEPEGR